MWYKTWSCQSHCWRTKTVIVSQNSDIGIISCENSKDIVGTDIILVSAGKPRTYRVKMTRRDLALQNGQIVKEIVESSIINNSGSIL